MNAIYTTKSKATGAEYPDWDLLPNYTISGLFQTVDHVYDNGFIAGWRYFVPVNIGRVYWYEVTDIDFRDPEYQLTVFYTDPYNPVYVYRDGRVRLAVFHQSQIDRAAEIEALGVE